ncbi:unnamed protein product [Porites evermanni]|uniref:Reverse transcriptase domain-containing protein n=1 Tax=Porites evermanni TaxID=104178 RepID=A0ABN8QFB9_9CNID|nr:unnamed protein product [Porites evermanni]
MCDRGIFETLFRSVNPFVKNFKFKYEGLPTLAVMFRENFWFFTFDIESGYHHLDINSNFWKFLGFSWSFNGVFCPSVCLQLVIYLRRCLNRSLLVGDPLVFLLLCILMMESLPADRY